MKWYSKDNYQRYKEDLKSYRSPVMDIEDKESLIKKFIDLPEKVARSFSRDEKMIGRVDFNDLIQEGMYGLCLTVDKVSAEELKDATNKEIVVASFIENGIKNHIRNFLRGNRATIKSSEYALKDKLPASNQVYFFNVLEEIGSISNSKSSHLVVDIDGELREYNYKFVVPYILGVFNAHLTRREKDIMTYWYGVGCEKLSLAQIQRKMKEKMTLQAISKIRKGAVEKIENKILSKEIVYPSK